MSDPTGEHERLYNPDQWGCVPVVAVVALVVLLGAWLVIA